MPERKLIWYSTLENGPNRGQYLYVDTCIAVPIGECPAIRDILYLWKNLLQSYNIGVGNQDEELRINKKHEEENKEKRRISKTRSCCLK